jgi:RNA polymerase sigma factor (sigma-70 family)
MNTLLIKARSGDTRAQEKLREAIKPRLESLAGYYASRTGMDANDLLQEAWLAVFEALPTLDVTIGTPVQYLLKQARWQILDHIRWNKRRTHDALDDLYTETMTEEENHFGTCHYRNTDDVEADLIVSDLERRLNERQKVILKGLLKGDTWRQIGEDMGCTSANVAYHVRGIREAYSNLVETTK